MSEKKAKALRRIKKYIAQCTEIELERLSNKIKKENENIKKENENENIK